MTRSRFFVLSENGRHESWTSAEDREGETQFAILKYLATVGTADLVFLLSEFASGLVPEDMSDRFLPSCGQLAEAFETLLMALEDKGLVTYQERPSTICYSLTDAGRLLMTQDAAEA